jgi:hypothetical protein
VKQSKAVKAAVIFNSAARKMLVNRLQSTFQRWSRASWRDQVQQVEASKAREIGALKAAFEREREALRIANEEVLRTLEGKLHSKEGGATKQKGVRNLMKIFRNVRRFHVMLRFNKWVRTTVEYRTEDKMFSFADKYR